MLESSRNLAEDSQVDIRSVAHGKIKNISDEQKQHLIANRKPRNGFEFAQGNIRTIVDCMEK